MARKYNSIFQPTIFWVSGQIYPSSLPEMLRVLRPGGYLLWTMKDGFQLTSPKFAVLDSYIQVLRKLKTQLFKEKYETIKMLWHFFNYCGLTMGTRVRRIEK